jgi:cytochrome bd ubiquinol oxidase subunit II
VVVLRLITISIVLAGLIAYTVLAGADFGAGFWQLLSGSGEWGRRLRDHAHHANAPVWEANHVWLILVITVLWTGYPIVFGSIFSTLAVPIFLAAIGIVVRGVAYTMQTAAGPRERRAIDTAFAASSIVTPFMLGSVTGAIASARVPVGNARGNMMTAWLNPTSIMAGCLAVATGAFLAAVHLSADAQRRREQPLAEAFRLRALVSGVAAGVVAIAGLVVVERDAYRLFTGLTTGWGLVAVALSCAAALSTLLLLAVRRYEAARLAAAVAVAALLIGWAAAQRPYVLPPELTNWAAAADAATLIPLIASIVVGAIILFPSLALLFRLALTGRFDPSPSKAAPQIPQRADARHPARRAQAALGSLIVGIVLLNIANASAAHVAGVLALGAAGIAAFATVAPDELAKQPSPVLGAPVSRRRTANSDE